MAWVDPRVTQTLCDRLCSSFQDPSGSEGSGDDPLDRAAVFLISCVKRTKQARRTGIDPKMMMNHISVRAQRLTLLVVPESISWVFCVMATVLLSPAIPDLSALGVSIDDVGRRNRVAYVHQSSAHDQTEANLGRPLHLLQTSDDVQRVKGEDQIQDHRDC